MARMLPPEMGDQVKSRAEVKIFELCKQDLGPEYTVLHSLGIAGREGKPWSEIDFVVVGPPGVFCIEVKGGRIARRDGMWHFTDGSDNTNTRREGPFDQAAGGAAQIHKFLINSDSTLSNVAVGSGVAMPDCKFDARGPDVEFKILFDERNLADPFSKFIRRLTDYWHGRLEQQGKRLLTLNQATVNRIVSLLRGDFDIRPSLKTRIGYVKDDLLKLTEEQFKVLDTIEENPRVLVQGGAGTGKTLLALEEARRRGKGGERVFFACLGGHLADSLKSLVSDIPEIEVIDLGRFMRETVAEAGLTDMVPSAAPEFLERTFYPETCLDALMTLDRLEEFDCVIVDEGQDLMWPAYLDIFDAILKGGLKNGSWKVFFDGTQNIKNGINAEGFKKLTDCHPTRTSLSINCRNSLQIATATHLMSGIPVVKTLKADGPDVNNYYYNDSDHQRKMVNNALNRLLSEKLEPSRICILGPKSFTESLVCDGLPSTTVRIVPDAVASLPNSKMVRYSTIKDFKGLDADAVLLVDMEDFQSDQSRFELYVAGTRACAFLEVFINSKAKDQYEQRVREYAHYCLENGV